VASEIALRDGARAVVLPTVAEVGGRLRVSAEVIDPTTQTTVYAESADGAGSESVLRSIDKVSRTLRGRLGESLSAIDASAQPLEKVATSNLDALRAFGLALRAHATGRFGDASELLLHAVELDPDFASAWLRLAAGWNTADRDRALGYVRKAERVRDRLMPRDQLHLDAYRDMFASPAAGLKQWRLMSELYPDYFVGQQNSALYGWQWENDFSGAVPLLVQVTRSQHPLRAMSFDLLGHVRLGTGEPDESLKAYAEAQALGLATVDFGKSATQLARRDYEAALADAGDPPPQLPAFFRLYAPFRRAMVELDRGQVVAARSALDAAVADAERQKMGMESRRFRAMALQVASATKDGADTAAIAQFVAAERAALASSSALYRHSHAFNLLVAAILQARHGQADAALATIATAAPLVPAGEFPVLENLLAIARAEVELARGDANAATRAIAPWIERRPLYLTHSVLLRSAALDRNHEATRRHAAWLQAHRGAAIAEWNDGYLLQPLNLLDGNLATLVVAETELAAGRRSEAEAALAALPADWPRTEEQLAATRRIAALRAKLSSLDESPHP
jgi:putative peptide modification system cyclase